MKDSRDIMNVFQIQCTYFYIIYLFVQKSFFFKLILKFRIQALITLLYFYFCKKYNKSYVTKLYKYV